MPEQLACEPLFGSHSKDRTDLYYGQEKPAHMCGKHATFIKPGDFRTMREAGTIN